MVDVGETEPVRIVCGAPNHQENDWVIVARPGAVLANGLAIKPTEIRGEKSQGMLCSEAELGISDAHDGIIILPAEHGFSAGAAAAQALARNDIILELGITPNRPDALSHVGVARDLNCACHGHGGGPDGLPSAPRGRTGSRHGRRAPPPRS